MDFMFLDDFLRAALAEDIGAGDVTTDACVPAFTTSRGRFVAKESGILCGLSVMSRVFTLLDAQVEVECARLDGERAEAGETIAEITGPSRAILKGERTALNLLQRLSGIATRTAALVEAVKDYDARITDTRKTTPGLRALEKYAVRVGGGANHRMGLYDGALIKDNHIAASGSIASAVKAVRAVIPHTLKIEVEAATLKEVQQALDAGADIIMLDNMSLADMKEAVALIDGRALCEASGNMGDKGLAGLAAVAACGVDIISIGALTHSVRAMDISLKLDM